MSALSDLGEFIREQRQNAKISLRQLSQLAGVSNPYLSQIERGLRKPSAEVLQQIGTALRISTPVMYLRAGLLEIVESGGVPAAIAADSELNERQKHVLVEIYETFRRENAAHSTENTGSAGEAQTSTGPSDAAASSSPSTSAAPRKRAPRTTRTDIPKPDANGAGHHSAEES